MNKQAQMAKIAYNALDEKKAEDIKVIDITEVSVMSDYFVIASAGSMTQMNALADNVEEKLHKAGYGMQRKEGNQSSTWLLLDFGDVVIHIFNREDRLFYDLERIWSDGKIIDPELLKE